MASGGREVKEFGVVGAHEERRFRRARAAALFLGSKEGTGDGPKAAGYAPPIGPTATSRGRRVVYIRGVSRPLPFLYAAEELANALSERLAPIFAAAELTATQFNVLYMLIEEGPMQLTALAEQRRCVKSNVSYITRAMLREGLVELSASPEDQRARVISASALGRRRYAAAKVAAQKLEHALRRALGAEAGDHLTQACLEAAAALDALP